MNDRTGALERRSDVRVSLKGTVMVRADDYIIRGRVENLSRGGLFASTRVTAARRLLGAMTAIELRLDGIDASWHDLRARVMRIEANHLALRFDAAPVSFTDAVEEMASRSLANDHALSVVLVDGIATRRDLLARGFRAAGCTVIETSTPLEAIVRLGESQFEPDLIAIADSLPAAISDDLRTFVDREHPRAVLVHIGHIAPANVAHWIATSDGDGELAARIRDVLRAPRR
jgi:hypothetical protein